MFISVIDINLDVFLIIRNEKEGPIGRHGDFARKYGSYMGVIIDPHIKIFILSVVW